MREPRVKIIAHRGASKVAPENTLAAIRKAVEIGVDGVEFDIHRTKDSQLVLMHDAAVDRTTNGKGKIADLSYDDIRGLDAGRHKGAEFAGEPVPLLRDALAALKGKAHAVIEVKDEGIAGETVREMDDMGMIGSATVICFHGATLQEIRQIRPGIATALLIGEKLRHGSGHLIRMAREARADLADMHWSLATPEVVSAFQGEGMAVWVWTVNEEDDMKRLAALGVDGITTDDPALLKEVLRREARTT